MHIYLNICISKLSLNTKQYTPFVVKQPKGPTHQETNTLKEKDWYHETIGL